MSFLINGNSKWLTNFNAFYLELRNLFWTLNTQWLFSWWVKKYTPYPKVVFNINYCWKIPTFNILCSHMFQCFYLLESPLNIFRRWTIPKLHLIISTCYKDSARLVRNYHRVVFTTSYFSHIISYFCWFINPSFNFFTQSKLTFWTISTHVEHIIFIDKGWVISTCLNFYNWFAEIYKNRFKLWVTSPIA